MIRFARRVSRCDLHRKGFFRFRLKKIFQNLKSRPAAFFRVELGGENVISLNAADKGISVIRGGQNGGILFRDDMKGVDKIEFFIPLQSIE